MFVHLSIHRPRPGAQTDLAASMHRFDAAGRGVPGFLAGHVLRDEAGGQLVGMTLWESEADWRAAVERQRAAIENDPFDEWELEPPQVFRLDEV